MKNLKKVPKEIIIQLPVHVSSFIVQSSSATRYKFASHQEFIRWKEFRDFIETRDEKLPPPFSSIQQQFP